MKRKHGFLSQFFLKSHVITNINNSTQSAIIKRNLALVLCGFLESMGYFQFVLNVINHLDYNENAS